MRAVQSAVASFPVSYKVDRSGVLEDLGTTEGRRIFVASMGTALLPAMIINRATVNSQTAVYFAMSCSSWLGGFTNCLQSSSLSCF